MARRKKIKAALIGCGRIGFTLGFDNKREQPASHTMTLKRFRRIVLESACDIDNARLEYFKRFNKKCVCYSNFSHLFASSKPDIVVIAVNENVHLKASLAAIHAKPRLVILEKPVARNSIEANLIQNEAIANNVPVLINHERRFAVDYNIAKSYLKKIGNILTINARLDSSMCVYNPAEEDSGGYSLLHDGTHLVDIIMFLLEDEIGEEKVLYNAKIASKTLDDKDKNIVRTLNVHFESKKCSDVNVFISGVSKYFGFEVEIIASEGRIKIGNGIFEFYKREKSKLYEGFYSLAKDKKVRRPKKTRYFYNMLKNAINFLDGKEYLKSTLQTGINTLKILDEIKEFLKSSE